MAKRNRVSAELVFLSSVAVAGIYGTGYTLTQAAAEALRNPQVVQVPHPAGYRDGAYLGSGHSAFGDVYVVVLIEHGKITQVSINHVTTAFPPGMIGSLPGQVVTRQSAAVDLVSGATGSSQSFARAVEAALAQARAS